MTPVSALDALCRWIRWATMRFAAPNLASMPATTISETLSQHCVDAGLGVEIEQGPDGLRGERTSVQAFVQQTHFYAPLKKSPPQKKHKKKTRELDWEFGTQVTPFACFVF